MSGWLTQSLSLLSWVVDIPALLWSEGFQDFITWLLQIIKNIFLNLFACFNSRLHRIPNNLMCFTLIQILKNNLLVSFQDCTPLLVQILKTFFCQKYFSPFISRLAGSNPQKSFARFISRLYTLADLNPQKYLAENSFLISLEDCSQFLNIFFRFISIQILKNFVRFT